MIFLAFSAVLNILPNLRKSFSVTKQVGVTLILIVVQKREDRLAFKFIIQIVEN